MLAKTKDPTRSGGDGLSLAREKSGVARAAAQRPENPFAIQTRGLTKKYHGVAAVDDLTVSIRRGGVVGFIGPNGSGKTTTIRMLLGLIRPTAGSAVVFGRSITTPRKYIHRVGALIEAPAFYPMLTARHNLEVLARLGGHDAARIDSVLETAGLSKRAEEPYKSFSLGMKQRLGIAAALLPDPDLLVLDEPTNGLDPAGIIEVRSLLRGLGDAGKTVFVSSHLLAEMQKLCDDVIIIRKGRLLFQGSIDSLMARQQGIVAAASEPSRHADVVRLCKDQGYEAHVRNGTVFVRAPASFAPLLNQISMKAGILLSELHAQTADIEDVVLEITGSGAIQ